MATTIKRVTGPGTKALQNLVKGLGNAQGKVGWFESEKYENGTPVAYVAAIQEFGSPQNSIPPRSFMRSTALEEKKKWAKTAEDGSKQIIKGSLDGKMVMTGIALQAKGDIQSKIASIQSPGLSDITLALRKVKLGMVPGIGPTVTGKTVGIVASKLKDGSLTPDGVSKKPLIEPAGIPGGGTLFTSIDVRVT